MKGSFIALLAMCALAVASATRGHVKTYHPKKKAPSCLSVAKKYCPTFVQTIVDQTPELAEFLHDSTSVVTFFCPIDDALPEAEIPEGTTIQDVLYYHVSDYATLKSSKLIKASPIPTILANHTLTADKEVEHKKTHYFIQSDLSIAMVTKADLKCGKGIVHVIDTVFIPDLTKTSEHYKPCETSPPPVSAHAPPPCKWSWHAPAPSPAPVTVSSPPCSWSWKSPPVAVSNPPPKCYSPVTVSSPPPKCYSPVMVSSPPPKCYSPPVTVSSPPPACYSPPPKCYSPPVTISSPPPACYSPPPVCSPPVTVNSPPPACYSPPPVCSPPVMVNSPPPACYSPPPVCSPPVTVNSPPPACYSPPPVCSPPVTVSSPPPACASPPPVCSPPVTVSSPPPACASPPPVCSPPVTVSSPPPCAASPPPYCAPVASCPSIYAQISADPNLSVLKTLIDIANLKGALSDTSITFTFFAPSNAALQNIGVAAMCADNANLVATLKNHIAPGVAIRKEQFTDGLCLGTLYNKNVCANVAYGNVILRAQGQNACSSIIPNYNIQACKSIIHTIDNVLVPSA